MGSCADGECKWAVVLVGSCPVGSCPGLDFIRAFDVNALMHIVFAMSMY